MSDVKFTDTTTSLREVIVVDESGNHQLNLGDIRKLVTRCKGMPDTAALHASNVHANEVRLDRHWIGALVVQEASS